MVDPVTGKNVTRKGWGPEPQGPQGVVNHRRRVEQVSGGKDCKGPLAFTNHYCVVGTDHSQPYEQPRLGGFIESAKEEESEGRYMGVHQYSWRQNDQG